jgi:hypothetical protein
LFEFHRSVEKKTDILGVVNFSAFYFGRTALRRTPDLVGYSAGWAALCASYTISSRQMSPSPLEYTAVPKNFAILVKLMGE